jgi:hypothetical protein
VDHTHELEDLRMAAKRLTRTKAEKDGMPWVPVEDPFAKDPPVLVGQGNAFFLSQDVEMDYLKVDIPHISFEFEM